MKSFHESGVYQDSWTGEIESLDAILLDADNQKRDK